MVARLASVILAGQRMAGRRPQLNVGVRWPG